MLDILAQTSTATYILTTGGFTALLIYLGKRRVDKIDSHIDDDDIHFDADHCNERHAAIEKSFDQTREDIKGVHQRIDKLAEQHNSSTQKILQAIAEKK